MPDLPGRIGPYQVLKRLGMGGMGEVLLAHDERLDREVAIKRIRADTGASAERRERFRREARVAAKLNHPAIVQIYDVLTEGDVNYIVLEYVEGTNLRRLLDDGPLPVGEAAIIGRDVAEGLAEAHRQGILHRDLKTENVLVTPAGRGKISDFGIAKSLLKGRTEDSLTALGHVIGTYRAMSPEQARGAEVDPRSDLFSLGVLLYEALTGVSPFEAENELAMLNRIVYDRQVPVREVAPAVPRGLSDLVDRLLQKDPLLRPRSAEEVARALAELAPGGLGTAGSATLVEPMLRPSFAAPAPSAASSPYGAVTARRPALRTLLWAGLPLALILGLAAAWQAFRPPAEPLYVAVLRPEIGARSGGVELDLMTSGVRTALVRGLMSLDGISPKAFEEIDPVAGSPRGGEGRVGGRGD